MTTTTAESFADDEPPQAPPAPAQIPKVPRFLGFRSIIALILREMATTYGRSPGGYLWALLDPIASIALLSFVFSFIVRTPPLGTNFPFFYASGLLSFGIYSDIANKVGSSIRYSKPLLAYPRVTYVDAMVSRLILNAITSTLVLMIVMSGITWVYDLKVYVRLDRIGQSIAMAIALGVGIGALNCFLATSFSLWDRIWRIATRPLMLVSGVIFLVDGMTEEIRNVLLWNPLVHVVGEMRAGFYMTYDATYVSPIYVYSVSIICLFFGMLLLNRYHKDMLSEGS